MGTKGLTARRHRSKTTLTRKIQYLRRLKFDGLLYITNRVVAVIPSHTLRGWFYRRYLKFDIGRNSLIFMEAWFDAAGGLTIGDNSVINQRCRIDNRGGIVIGDNVSISAEVCILTADHNLQSEQFEGRSRPIKIHDYVFIGTRAMILPGVTLGRNSAVAAGAVVTKDVPTNTIVAGVPAKPIGTREVDSKYNAFYPRLFF